MRTCVPTIAGSPPNNAVHPVWLRTTSGGAPGSDVPSPWVSVRPACRADSNHLKIVTRHELPERQPSVDAGDDVPCCECGREYPGLSAKIFGTPAR